MKAIIFENHKGVKNFLPFASEKHLFKVFNKICSASGWHFCTSEKQFDEVKRLFTMTDIIYKRFLGIGIYNYDGEFSTKLIQSEGKYYIDDYNEKTNDITVCKIVLDKAILN